MHIFYARGQPPDGEGPGRQMPLQKNRPTTLSVTPPRRLGMDLGEPPAAARPRRAPCRLPSAAHCAARGPSSRPELHRRACTRGRHRADGPRHRRGPVTSADAAGLPVSQVADLVAADPTRRWLVDGLWSQAAVHIIGGAPKSAKSWMALDMAVSVASDTPCLGACVVRLHLRAISPNSRVLPMALTRRGSELRTPGLAMSFVRQLYDQSRPTSGNLSPVRKPHFLMATDTSPWFQRVRRARPDAGSTKYAKRASSLRIRRPHPHWGRCCPPDRRQCP